MSDEIQEIRNVFHGLETLYHIYLPKVDPMLINDLLIREKQKEHENSGRAPFYMVEVFTKPGTNCGKNMNRELCPSLIYLSIFTNPFSPINKQVNNKISIFLLGSISPTSLGNFPHRLSILELPKTFSL